MRKYSFYYIALLFFICSCGSKKKDNPAPVVPLPSNYLVYTVNGQADTLVNCEMYVDQPYHGMARMMGFDANGSDIFYPYFFFSIDSFKGVGTYAFGTADSNKAAFIKSITDSRGAVSGVMNITSSSPYAGTFSFTCGDSTKIVNASFKCKPL